MACNRLEVSDADALSGVGFILDAADASSTDGYLWWANHWSGNHITRYFFVARSFVMVRPVAEKHPLTWDRSRRYT